jgi:hippurate hydrolase
MFLFFDGYECNMNQIKPSMTVDEKLQRWMRDIRRKLHQYPELSFQEQKTSLFIQKRLKELDVSYRSGWGGTGVIATLGEGEVHKGHVGLRADMDALPIEEKNLVPYASKFKGVMHACGHDGHVAMLLGAIVLLKKYGCRSKVSCIFQPAEEHGNGADRIIREGALDGGVQVVFGGHIDTHFPTGVITVDEGVICSFADPFSITLRGQSGHAARPHEAKDSLVAGAYLVTGLQTLISRETDPNKAAVLTLGRFASGTAHNIIADEAVIDGTLRNSDPIVRDRLLAGLRRMSQSIGDQFNLQASIVFHENLPAVINSAYSTQIARQAALEVVGVDQVVSQGRPSLGAEDFAFYQQKVDGCLVRFGANSLSDNSPAHSSSFDFDENVLSIGAHWLARVAMDWTTVP